MLILANGFVPLMPGEKPGDPEMGGWRPLPIGLFTKGTKVVPVQSEATELSLAKAVSVVVFGVGDFHLREAIRSLTQRLSRYHHN